VLDDIKSKIIKPAKRPNRDDDQKRRLDGGMLKKEQRRRKKSQAQKEQSLRFDPSRARQIPHRDGSTTRLD
jgi:hypothetical protein